MPPPFGKFRIATAHVLHIALGVGGIGQRSDNIDNDEPPFVVVDGSADLLAPEQKTEVVAGERDLPKRLTAERKEARSDNLERKSSLPVCPGKGL